MIIEYLIFNIMVVLGPVLVLLFYHQVSKPMLKPMVFSIGVSAFLFIVWDIIVTGHFWDFNQKYFLGYKLWTIPIEEALFFLSVPFACLFLYVNVRSTVKKVMISKFFLAHITVLTLFVGGTIFWYWNLYYSASVILLLGLIWLADLYLFKTKLLLTNIYWRFIGLVLLLTFCFNYYLTSRPVVLYNNSLNTNVRLLTIPVEDFAYSICLITLVVMLYEHMSSKASSEM